MLVRRTSSPGATWTRCSNGANPSRTTRTWCQPASIGRATMGVCPTTRPSMWSSPQGVAPTNRRPTPTTAGRRGAGRGAVGVARCAGGRGAGRSTTAGAVSGCGTGATGCGGSATMVATSGGGDASRKPISPAAASAITSAAPSASRRRIRARGPPGSYPSSHNTGGATGGGASGAAGGDTDAGSGAAPAASAATRSRTVAYRSCGSGLRARVSASRAPRARCGGVVRDAGFERTGEGKITQQGQPCGRHHDVRGLYVSVRHAAAVRVVQGGCELLDEAQAGSRLQRPAVAQHVVQRSPVDVRHRVPQQLRRTAESADGDDVGVIECRPGRHGGLKPFAGPLLPPGVREHLQGDHLPGGHVPSEVDAG